MAHKGYYTGHWLRVGEPSVQGLGVCGFRVRGCVFGFGCFGMVWGLKSRLGFRLLVLLYRNLTGTTAWLCRRCKGP